MALIRFDYRSEVLELSTTLTALVPETPAPAAGFPVLYLLHGLSDDATMWARKTSLERYLESLALPLMVVMPNGYRSYYNDEAHGIDHWAHITAELPNVVERTFRVSTAREDTYVAGLSMGGYGAMRWALSRPERFIAAASFSGALGLAQRTVDPLAAGALDRRLWDTIFDGQDVTDTSQDLLWLLRSRADEHIEFPALHVTCGTEDALLAENQAFIDTARDLDIPLHTDVRSGAHTWDFWDVDILAFLTWLANSRTNTPGSAARTFASTNSTEVAA